MAERKNKKGERSAALSLLIAGLIGCAASIALALAFSFVLMKQWLTIDAMPYINAGIKVASSLIAALIAIRRAENGALLKGAAAGLIYMALTTLVFSLLSGGFSPSAGLLTDFAMCALVGAVAGVVRNLKR